MVNVSPSTSWSRFVNSFALGSPRWPESTQWLLSPPTGRLVQLMCPAAIWSTLSSVPW